MEFGFLAKDAFEMALFCFSKFSFEVEREAKPSCKQLVLFLIVFLFFFFLPGKKLRLSHLFLMLFKMLGLVFKRASVWSLGPHVMLIC